MKRRTPTILLLLSCCTAGLQATTIIPITNSSFETPDNPAVDGAFGTGEAFDFGNTATSITGWTIVTTDNSTVSVSGANQFKQVSVGFKNITPAAGDQVLSLMSGTSIAQNTGTAWSSLSAGDTITMTVALGNRDTSGVIVWSDSTFFGVTDGLATGRALSSTVGNSGLITVPPATDGSMADSTFDYTVLASDLTRSGNIGVLLVSFDSVSNINTRQAFFDNVRLSVTPVPEPSGAGLFGLVGALLLTRRRR